MIKTEGQIKKLRVAGKILASVSKKVEAEIKEGVKLTDLNKLA